MDVQRVAYPTKGLTSAERVFFPPSIHSFLLNLNWDYFGTFHDTEGLDSNRGQALHIPTCFTFVDFVWQISLSYEEELEEIRMLFPVLVNAATLPLKRTSLMLPRNTDNQFTKEFLHSYRVVQPILRVP